MANKLVAKEPSSSESLITLESLQAAVKGICSKQSSRPSGIRIGLCDVHPIAMSRDLQVKSNFEYVVRA
jgi:hypothetical protein